MENREVDLKKEVKDLYNTGVKILFREAENEEVAEVPAEEQEEDKSYQPILMDYQNWYSKALPVVRQLLPERYQEFKEQYKIEKRKEIDFLTYAISDYLIGLRIIRGYPKTDVVDAFSAFSSKFRQQLSILYSAIERVDSAIADIQGVLQSELFDSELHAAEDLLKKKHLRAAGALSGVTLESHLSKVLDNHNIKLRKKSPTASDYNEALKKDSLIDIPTWRLIQRLSDIRNLSVHAKEREPTPDEIEDLIEGVKKIISTVF